MCLVGYNKRIIKIDGNNHTYIECNEKRFNQGDKVFIIVNDNIIGKYKIERISHRCDHYSYHFKDKVSYYTRYGLDSKCHIVLVKDFENYIKKIPVTELVKYKGYLENNLNGNKVRLNYVLKRMDNGDTNKKSKNGENESKQLILIKNNIITNSISGQKIKKSLKDKYNINIMNIEIIAGRGKHYDLLLYTDLVDDNNIAIKYKVEYKGNYKISEIKLDLHPWYNGVQFYNGDPKPFTILYKYSKEWFNNFINNDEYMLSYCMKNSKPTYEIWLKDAFKQGKNTIPFMLEFKDKFCEKKGGKTSMLEERKIFNKSFNITENDLEILKNEISPIYTKIMKEKELWLQITGNVDANEFNVNWTKGLAFTKIPELKNVTIKTLTPDIKFKCECEKICVCENNVCECIPFIFEAHLRWGYGQGYSNLRLDFK